MTFRRRRTEKFVAALCALVVLEAPYLAWRINVSPQETVVRKGGMVLRGVYMQTCTFWLIGRSGGVLFSRTQIAGKRALSEFDADAQAVNNFLRLAPRRPMV